MAIPMPGLDRLTTGPVRDFVEALHDLYDAAGQPSARVVGKATYALPPGFETVSHETVSAALRASKVPSWEKVRAIIHVFVLRAALTDIDPPPGLESRMKVLWHKARRVTQAGDTGLTTPDEPVRRSSAPAAVRTTVALGPARPATAGPRPEAVPDFVGREPLLTAIGTALATGPDARVVLYGPAGAGKTQTVLRYLDRHDPGVPVWWVPAGTVESARRSLMKLATSAGLAAHHRTERAVRRVLDLVESGQIPHLLVFDDLDVADLPSLVPNRGRVVITTRDPALGQDGSSLGIEVGDLSPDEAGRLLRRHEPDVTAQTVAGLLAVYGRSPLALAQVVAWSRATGTPLADDGQADPADRLSAGPVTGYPDTADLAMLFIMDRLEAASRPALHLLNALARFAPVPISTALLNQDLTASGAAGGPEAPRDAMAMSRALVELCRHGLARLTADGRHVEVVAPARLIARRAMSREEFARAGAYAQALLAAADPGWPDDQTATERYREIAAHVRDTGLVDSADPRARRTVYHQIRFLYLAGDNAAACELGELADQRWRGDTATDDGHLVLLASQERANALRALGRYDAARSLTLTAMSQLRLDPGYGENHPYTLAMASSQAADLRITGDYARALQIDRETFQRCLAAFRSENHQRTTMSGHNLAISLRFAGHFRDAEEQDRWALRRHQEMFGDDNWRTLLSINALAEDLLGQGRYQDVLVEVEPFVRRVTQRRREEGRALTRMDRGLILARRAIAVARRGLGQYGEALEELDEAYAECAALFGERNQFALAVRMSRANTVHLIGRAEDASREAEQVLGEYRDLLGATNPLTLAAGINVANVLRARGDHLAALTSDRFSSEELRERVGREHPFAVAAQINLASDYAQYAHPHRLAASRQAVELAKQVHSTDHPHVIAAEGNLALDLAAAGERSAAAKRLQAIEHLHVAYGAGHPITERLARGERLDCVLEPPIP